MPKTMDTDLVRIQNVCVHLESICCRALIHVNKKKTHHGLVHNQPNYLVNFQGYIEHIHPSYGASLPGTEPGFQELGQ